MGIFKATINSAGSMMEEQWKEFFCCESMPDSVMVVRAQRISSGKSSGNQGPQHIISDGSIINVADGTSAVVVENGKVIAVFQKPGENIFESSKTPSIFSGARPKHFMKSMMERISFGGELPVNQSVYYVNTKEILGNPFHIEGVPFPIADQRAGADMDGAITCSGMFSFKVTDPGKFYKETRIHAHGETGKKELCSFMQSQISAAFQSAVGGLAVRGIRPWELTKNTGQLCDQMNQEMEQGFAGQHGIKILSISFHSFRAEDSTNQILFQIQGEARLNDSDKIAVQLGNAQAQAMVTAAKNKSAGAVSIFAGTQTTPPSLPGEWFCTCGTKNKGSFCTECGKKKEEDWLCSCGTKNKGSFCTECGKKKPNHH